LTYGEATLTDRLPAPGMDDALALQAAASVERYSKHPLARPILAAAVRERLVLLNANAVRERAGEGLEGEVGGRQVRIIGRRQA
jgi:cation transport ATPase